MVRAKLLTLGALLSAGCSSDKPVPQPPRPPTVITVDTVPVIACTIQPGDSYIALLRNELPKNSSGRFSWRTSAETINYHGTRQQGREPMYLFETVHLQHALNPGKTFGRDDYQLPPSKLYAGTTVNFPDFAEEGSLPGRQCSPAGKVEFRGEGAGRNHSKSLRYIPE